MLLTSCLPRYFSDSHCLSEERFDQPNSLCHAHRPSRAGVLGGLGLDAIAGEKSWLRRRLAMGAGAAAVGQGQTLVPRQF